MTAGVETAGVATGPAHRGALPPLLAYLARLHEDLAGLDEGEVAGYIPELARAERAWFGICIATPGGNVYEVGDTRVPFTIQSISKPLTFGLVLGGGGCGERLRDTVGLEPSGDAFNAISLAPGSGRPVNPMINAGAIAAASLVRDAAGDPFGRILHAYGRFAGRELALDEVVYRSELATAHRNRAIANLLRAHDVIDCEADAALDLYTRQCAVSVDCRDLAVIAATLANDGVNPLTGEEALDAHHVRDVLSVMTTCGMYDFAGEWLHGVGLPAKSGVSGGVLAVLPGRLGIGVFSPPLDRRGNSVRGVRVCTAIAGDFDVHVLDGGRPAVPPVRAAYTLAQVRSKRVRTPAERDALDHGGGRVCVLEIQGELELSAFEQVAARVLGEQGVWAVVVDLSRVSRAEAGLTPLLSDLALVLAGAGTQLVCVVREPLAPLVAHARRSARADGELWAFASLDEALERCEDDVLARLEAADPGDRIEPAAHPVLDGLDGASLGHVVRLLDRVELGAGEHVVRSGEPAAVLLLVTGGRLSVLRRSGEDTVRAATLSAGMVVGEIALVDRAPRSADVVADTDVELYALGFDDFDALGGVDPFAQAVILRNLLREATGLVRRLNAELRALTDPVPPDVPMLPTVSEASCPARRPGW